MFNNNFYAGNCGVDPDAGYDFPNGPTPEEEVYITLAGDYNLIINELLNKLKEINIKVTDGGVFNMIAADLESLKY